MVAGLTTTSAVAGDPARGAQLFQYCYACHTLDPAEAGRVQGPLLRGVAGRTAGSLQGYAFSPAMRKAGEGGQTWTPEALRRFIANPSALVPGTAMALPFRLEPDELDDIVAFLVSPAAR